MVAFQDAVDSRFIYPDNPSQLLIASGEEAGSTNGLAYDHLRQHVYAAAFNGRDLRFGPGGPGGIYRIDLVSGAVELWATLDAGPDHHDSNIFSGDYATIPWIGRSSLGDIEIDSEAATLFVTNLHDRRIYRLSVPEGRVLSTFDNGAAGEAWAENARPFGLGFRGGWLWHGVVDSRENAALPGQLSAHIYRSLPDGSAMKEVLNIPLDYPRTPLWQAWTDDMAAPTAPTPNPTWFALLAEPIVHDIEFERDGNPIIGLGNRRVWFVDRSYGEGDVLPTSPQDDGTWSAMAFPDHYIDEAELPEPLMPWIQESSLGALAAVPHSDQVVASARFSSQGDGGIRWYDNATGAITGPNDGRETIFADLPGMGDIESLCPPDVPPTPTPTASTTLTTIPSPTPTHTGTSTPSSTPSPTYTATATPTFTATPMPSVRPIFLPIVISGACPTTRRHLDVVLVLDMSTSMEGRDSGGHPKHVSARDAAQRLIQLLDFTPGGINRSDQAAVVGFNATAWVEQALTGDPAAAMSALDALPERIAEFTRLDLALLAARDVVETSVWSSANQPIVILLTDGLPNRVPPAEDGRPETTILRAAERLKQAGAQVYTIGLGRREEVNADLLQTVASSPGHYRYAPDAGDLAGIYTRIGLDLVCPASGLWP